MCVRVCFRLCSLAQDAKQEAEDATVTTKSIKPDPAMGGEEEVADIKVSISGDDEETQEIAEASLGPSCLMFFLYLFVSVMASLMETF